MYQIIIIIFRPNPEPGILPAATAAILSLATMHIFDIHGIGAFLLWWFIYAIISSVFRYLSLIIAIGFLVALFTWVIPGNEKKEGQLIDKWYLESDELTPINGGYSSSLYTDKQGEQSTWEDKNFGNHKILERPTSVPPEMLPGLLYYKKSVSALRGDRALVEILSSYSVNTPPKENEKVYPIVKVYEIQYCMEPNPYCKKSGIDNWVVISGKVLRPELADKNYENWISRY